MDWLTPFLLSIFAVLVWVTDSNRQKIPNTLILLGVLMGASAQLGSGGLSGVGSGLAGLVLAALVMLPMYVMGGMAAGDVKAMGVVGLMLGFPDCFIAVGLTLLLGALLAIGWLAASVASGSKLLAAAKTRFPYGVAIGLGALLTASWQTATGFVR